MTDQELKTKAETTSLTHTEFVEWFKSNPGEANEWFKDYLKQEDSDFNGAIKELVELDDQCNEYDYLLIVFSHNLETHYVHLQTSKNSTINLWANGSSEGSYLIWDKRFFN